jgi:hypothetical protein
MVLAVNSPAHDPSPGHEPLFDIPHRLLIDLSSGILSKDLDLLLSAF